jgi:type IV secretion system protein VirB9
MATEKELETHRPRNFDYWYCGNPAIQPVAASDDGVHTRIRFAAHAEEPAIFVRNEDGTESLLNFSMDDGDVILHRVAHRLILRRGKLAGCIVNKGFVGSGERMKSNTTSEAVERATKGPRS